jgi:thioredoxin-like negative regulator of GroEL
MSDYQTAEDLRKAEKFAEAEPLFAELWTQAQHRMSGWRYAFCLRKQGKFDEALEVAQTVVEQLPDDQWSKNELIRALYDARVKPAKEQDDLFAVLEAADEAIRLGASELSLKLIVFAVMDGAPRRWPPRCDW